MLFLVQLLNNSLTRGGAVREPWVTSTITRLHFGVPFFLSVFLHSFFQHKITSVSKMARKVTPQSTPNPILKQPFTILWKPCFGTTLHCFYYILRLPPAPKGTRNTAKAKPKKSNANKHDFLGKKLKSSESDLQMVSKWVTLYPAIRLWRVWWHLWRLSLSFFSKLIAKVTHKCQK